MLERHRAEATFFTVGTQLATQQTLARRIVRDGHALANHTYNHADLTRLSAGAFFSEIDRTHALIRRLTGTTPRSLRPPYGATNRTVHALAAQRGYRVVLWDIDPQDWRRPGAAAIASNVIANARNGGIVVMHDGGGDRSQTVAALERILTTLSARGYSFRRLPQ